MVVSRPRRNFAELTRRRRLAARLFAQGESVLASVARQVKASRQSVCRWYRQWKQGGVEALKGAGRAGRRPSLNQVQLGKVERALRQGARHNGFQADLWTLPRVATVIERVTGVRFHPGHVWRVLGRIDWTVQKPARQAKERDESKVAYWKAVRWPELKKNACQQHAWIFFQDESGFTQQPSVRTTWAPRGETPVLRPRGNHWSKTSVAAALGFRWDGQRARLLARTKPDSYNTASLIEFLKTLRQFVARQKVILIWDHLPAHRSHEMKQFLFSQREWLQIEWLPGYAPDLNPTEGVWNNIKGKEMANLCPDQMDEAKAAFRRGLRRLSHTTRLPFSFLSHAGLSF